MDWKRWLVIVVALGSLNGASASEYYVATNGNNANPGTLGAPFATVQHAADMMSAGDSCYIRGGHYREAVSIYGENNLTFSAYEGEEVILDGSKEIDSGWTQYSGNIYKTTLSENVWQLFVNGEMMIPARWPNADPNTDLWEQWESEQWAQGRDERNYGSNPPFDSNGTMYDLPHDGIDLANSGINLSNALVVLNVGSFRTQTSIIDGHETGSGMFTYPPVTITFKDKEHFYFAEGKLELLDAENEWFFDTETKELYLWVPGGGSPAGLEIRGKNTIYCLSAFNCNDLTVSGIDFFAGTFNLDDCQRARVEHCELTYPSTTRRMLRIIEEPKTTMLSSDDATVFNCTFAYTDGHGMEINGDDSSVENCYFHHIDYSCSDLPSVMPAIFIGGDRVTFRHNTIHSFGASVGALQGMEGTTEYNNFYKGAFKQHDGAMVQVMVAKQLNANIGWNWVHDWSRLGIRFDGGDGQGGLVHHSVGWGPDMNSTVFIGNHENNEIINNSGVYSSARPEIVVESGGEPPVNNTNSITRNNCARQIAGTTADGSPVPGIVDHNWDGYDLGLDIRTQLRDPDNLDFRPLPGADIVDAGVEYPGVTDGYVGSAPDIGAYEYGAANYWIAGHQAEQASMPIPPNGTSDAKGSASLIWQPALGALSNEVYLGTSSNAVANATTASSEYQGSTENNIWNPLGLYVQTYFWRIDSVTSNGTVKGAVWSFAASDVSATPPGVINTAATDVTNSLATIGGQITDAGTASKVWLHWWPAGGPTNLVEMGVQDYAFTLPVTGLESNTLYYYQSQASNTYGTSWTSVASFTTNGGSGGENSGGTLLAYEGFDYPVGNKPHGLNGGQGFSSAWVSSQNGLADEYFEIVEPGDSWGSLPVAGNRLKRTSTSGKEALSRTISADLDATNLWFSVLVRPGQNEGFAIAGSALKEDGSIPDDTVDGNAGFGFVNDDDANLIAAIWDDSGARSNGSSLPLSGQGVLQFIVGKISFNSGAGGEDELSLYSVGSDLVLPGSPGATHSLDVDESVLDTLTIENNRGPGYDEIRIGRTFADVISDESAPPPEEKTYKAWISKYGLSGSKTNYTAHSDSDGMNQLVEYAFGGNPTNSDSGDVLPDSKLVEDGGSNWIEYVYRRRSDHDSRGLSYRVEANTNLLTDSWSTNGVMQRGSGVIDEEFDSVTNQVEINTDRTYIRLNVEIE